MKVGEVTSSQVKAEYLHTQDVRFFVVNPDFDVRRPLVINLTLVKLLKVVDLYKD